MVVKSVHNKLLSTRNDLQILLKFTKEPLILAAGMPRSGSTLLFNILREILQTRWNDRLSFGWIGDFNQLPQGDIYLLKVHQITFGVRLRSQHIFYSFRDIRTAMVSAKRKFGIEPSVDLARSYVSEYIKAKRFSNLSIKYEILVNELEYYIDLIAKQLGITVDSSTIADQVSNLQLPSQTATFSKTTLLHPNHITNTALDDWRTELPMDLQKVINQEFLWWFQECGYPEN